MKTSETGIFIRRLSTKIGKDQISQSAAAIAYFAWVSFLPLLLAAVAGFGIWLGSEEAMRQTIRLFRENFPALEAAGIDFRKILEDVSASRGRIGVVALAGLIWVGMQVVLATETALCHIFYVSRRSGWIVSRLRAISYLLMAGVFGMVSVAGVVALKIAAGMHLAWLVSLVLLSFVFAFSFSYLPRVRIPLAKAFAGGATAAVLWTAANTLLFVYFSDYSNIWGIYGPFAGIVIVMVAIYYLAYVTLVGAEVSSVLMSHPEVALEHPNT